MLFWGLTLFVLGILAVLDSQFNYGHIFRSANSFLFMLISLGVLIRTKHLMAMWTKERLILKNDELRATMLEMRDAARKDQK